MHRVLCSLIVIGITSIGCGAADKCGSGAKCGARDPSDETAPVVPVESSLDNPQALTPPTPATPPASSGTASRGGINEKGARSENSYDKENTDVVLARAGRQVKQNCGASKDETGTAVGPWGKVTVKVLLGRNGHSKSVTVPSPYSDKPVGRCITQAFTNLTFPPWAGQDTEVDWEVELVKPEKTMNK